jgi:ligand-binding SRPBCC domain-containing protein
MKIREWKTELWLPVPPDKLFEFFGDAANLDAITPDWLHFQILTPMPMRITAGSLIDYRLRLRGFPVRWRTHINVWEPPHRFIDEQIRGPYRMWVHEHTFVPERNGTMVQDYVRYAVPFDWLVHAWLVRPDIEKIFAFRAETLRKKFGE